MEIVLVGLNHKSAPVEIRERLAFNEQDIPEALDHLRAHSKAEEILLLSTCNRTEVVCIHRAPCNGNSRSLIGSLCDLRSSSIPANEIIYQLRGEDAVRHLLRVAAGLDSMILGESQILNQIKQAYSIASESGATSLYLNRIMHTAFRTGRRARTETEIGAGAVSVAYAAVSLARKVFGDFARHTGLVIGAGEMAESAARGLQEMGIGSLLFVNRTDEKAERLAHEFDGESVPFADLMKAMERADIVISSTSSPEFILTHERFHGLMGNRSSRPLFLIDIAVPRDIDPEIDNHENTFLYDIDSLQSVADQNLARRQKAIPAAEAIVEEELAGYNSWAERLKTEPVIRLLQERFDNVRDCEVQRSLRNFCPHESEDLDRLTRAIQKKVLHHPMEIIRQFDPESEEGQQMLDLVQKLFDLK